MATCQKLPILRKTPSRLALRLEIRWKALVGESAGTSPAVGKTERVAWALLTHFDVVINDFLDEHENRTRIMKVVLTDRCV